MYAILSPTSQSRSIRADQLSQDARDLLAWGFRDRRSVFGTPFCGAEVLIGPDAEAELRRIAWGDADGYCGHSGSDALRYFPRRDDPAWAVVFPHDCDGSAERGAAIAERLRCESQP